MYLTFVENADKWKDTVRGYSIDDEIILHGKPREFPCFMMLGNIIGHDAYCNFIYEEDIVPLLDSKKYVKAKHVVDLLNELFEYQPEFIASIVNARFPVNTLVANHPFIQVTPDRTAGFLGIINGFFGEVKDGHRGHVNAIFNDDGKLIKFEEEQP
jgi:hypothetical protein